MTRYFDFITFKTTQLFQCLKPLQLITFQSENSFNISIASNFIFLWTSYYEVKHYKEFNIFDKMIIYNYITYFYIFLLLSMHLVEWCTSFLIPPELKKKKVFAKTFHIPPHTGVTWITLHLKRNRLLLGEPVLATEYRTMKSV